MLKGQHVFITMDGRTSCANDTHMSLTTSLIVQAWKLVTHSVDCSKSEVTTTGDAFADCVKAEVAKHALKGNVAATITDCEPSMAEMERSLEEARVCVHPGCCSHC